MDQAAGLWACLALRHCRGLGPKSWKGLLEHYGSAAKAVAAPSDWAARGLVGARAAREFLSGQWRTKAEEELALTKSCGAKLICWDDPAYPELLRHIYAPPLLLYAQGDAGLLNNPALAVVGARQASRSALTLTADLAAGLSKAGITVVSGLALGIDAQAHKAALDFPGSSIAVLGVGIDLVYPAGNHDLLRELVQKGLVLSEFAPGTPPLRHNFPQRNRLIAGLSLGVLVTQAGERSGSLITARLAMEAGREVFAVPGGVDDPDYAGCHELIRQGARLTRSVSDILEELKDRLSSYALASGRTGRPPAPASRKTPPDRPEAPTERPEIPTDLTAEQRALLELLSASKTAHIDDLGRGLNWPPAKISTALLVLEMRGLVAHEPGMIYYLVD